MKIFHDTITLKLTNGSDSWYFTSAYASLTYTKRLELWDYLTNNITTITEPCLLMEDFNEVLLPSEQKRGNFNRNKAYAFLKVLDSCNLLDVSTVGGMFTWSRNYNGQRRVSNNLDRGLADLPWRLTFLGPYVEVLCMFHSDHNPLMLRCGGLPQASGQRPFRFEAAWITRPHYA